MRQLWHQFKEIKELEKKLAQVQKDLAETKLEVSSGGGAVKIVINGEQRIERVKLSPEAVEDIEVLEDLLVVAINEAISKSQELAQKKIQELTGGLKIPGLF